MRGRRCARSPGPPSVLSWPRLRVPGSRASPGHACAQVRGVPKADKTKRELAYERLLLNLLFRIRHVKSSDNDSTTAGPYGSQEALWSLKSLSLTNTASLR